MALNPKLEKGDKIVLLHMKGETMPPGLKGVVLGVSNLMGEDIYDIEWENSRKLSLLSTEDAWRLSKTKLKESSMNDFLMKNLDVKYFKPTFLVEYLKDIRESGIVNMFGASPYLYMGKARIEHEFHYHEFSNEDSEEAFQRVLEKADKAQSIMIQGCMKVLEKEGKEITVESINSCLPRQAQKLLIFFINLLSMK